MSSIAEQIKTELGDLLENAGFRITDEAYDDPQHFGNAVVTFCSDQWCIRIVRDRGQFFLWFRDRAGRSRWRNLGYLLAAYYLITEKGPGYIPTDEEERKELADFARRLTPINPIQLSDLKQVDDYLKNNLGILTGLARNWLTYSEPLEAFLNEMGNQERQAAADRIFGIH
jgi:hypothetical protein